MTVNTVEEWYIIWIVLQDAIVERTCCNIYAKCFGEDGQRGGSGNLGKKVRIGWVRVRRESNVI